MRWLLIRLSYRVHKNSNKYSPHFFYRCYGERVYVLPFKTKYTGCLVYIGLCRPISFRKVIVDLTGEVRFFLIFGVCEARLFMKDNNTIHLG